jgi:hypothetical protein
MIVAVLCLQQLLVVPIKYFFISSSALMRLARLETLAWNFGPFAAPFPFNRAHTLKQEHENSEVDKTLLKKFI